VRKAKRFYLVVVVFFLREEETTSDCSKAGQKIERFITLTDVDGKGSFGNDFW